MVNVTFNDGNPSHPAIRFDVAMSAALACADRHDDVQVMALCLDALKAARELRDPERVSVALYAMAGAQARYEHDRALAITPREIAR